MAQNDPKGDAAHQLRGGAVGDAAHQAHGAAAGEAASGSASDDAPRDGGLRRSLKNRHIQLIALGGAIGTGAVFIVKKRKNTPEPTDQQEP